MRRIPTETGIEKQLNLNQDLYTKTSVGDVDDTASEVEPGYHTKILTVESKMEDGTVLL